MLWRYAREVSQYLSQEEKKLYYFIVRQKLYRALLRGRDIKDDDIYDVVHTAYVLARLYAPVIANGDAIERRRAWKTIISEIYNIPTSDAEVRRWSIAYDMFTPEELEKLLGAEG